MNERKGFIVERDGKLYVRIQWTDSLGNRRELMRRATDRKHARELKKELCKQLDDEDAEQKLATEKTTFKELAERYEAQKLIPALYVGDRKVAGRRNAKSPKIYLRYLVEHFGKAKLRFITHAAIDAYRLKRLGEGLSIASTNRELEVMRAVLNHGKREGLIDKTPFELGAPLIHKADETRRTRVMSQDEEARLLAQCVGRRAHLRPLVIAAVDSGARRGELFTLTWADVNLPGRTISIRAFHTKTMQPRTVPITERLHGELIKLYDEAEDKAAGLVFGITDNVNKSWASANRDAGITGLRLHDLRATFISRMIEMGMPAEEVSKISGHSQLQTLYGHYLRITNETVGKAADLLNQMHSGEAEDEAGYVN